MDSHNHNNVTDPTYLSLRESAEIEQLIGTKLRIAQYVIEMNPVVFFKLPFLMLSILIFDPSVLNLDHPKVQLVS